MDAHPAPTEPASLNDAPSTIGWAALAPEALLVVERPRRRWLTGARFAAFVMSVGGPLFDLFLFWALAESGDLSEIAGVALVAILVGSFIAAGVLFAVEGRGVRGALEALVIPLPVVGVVLVSASEEPLDSVLLAALLFLVVALPVETGYLAGRIVARVRRRRGGVMA